MKTIPNCAGKSALIVFQAASPGNAKEREGGALRRGGPIASSGCPLVYVMEALPMITPKTLAGGMEFLVAVGLSALAGLLAFLLVSVVANVLGLSGG